MPLLQTGSNPSVRQVISRVVVNRMWELLPKPLADLRLVDTASVENYDVATIADKLVKFRLWASERTRILHKSRSRPGWVEFAPPIAGLPGFTEAQAIAFFTMGKDVSGKFAAPPMPTRLPSSPICAP